MKKDTEERILDYVIRINTDILKIHGNMDDMKQDIKELKEHAVETDRRFDRIDSDISGIKSEIHEINMKLDNRLATLELAAA